MSDYNPVIADLDIVLSEASVATVLDSANRQAASCSPHPNAVAAFCWQSGDEFTTEWYPQGITTSADASSDGEYQGRTVVLTSWYYSGSGDNKGVRVLLRKRCKSLGATLSPRPAGRALMKTPPATRISAPCPCMPAAFSGTAITSMLPIPGVVSGCLTPGIYGRCRRATKVKLAVSQTAHITRTIMLTRSRKRSLLLLQP